MTKNLYERGEPYTKKKWNIIRAQIFIVNVLNKFPGLIKIAKYLLDFVRIMNYQRRSKNFSTYNEINIDKIYWVQPQKIQYASLREFDVLTDKGKEINGDWDLLKRPFEELDVYIAFKEHFHEGKKWETTVFYKRILNNIHQGEYLWGCKNETDFNIRLHKLDNLFESIKNNGYKTQQELLTDPNKPDPIKLEDEIAVNIGRNGDLLFNNGAHRLCIAKLLNTPKIPIKITVRHSQWMDFKRQILLYAKNQITRKIYHPITHIDLQDIPSFHTEKIDRFNIMQSHLSHKKGTLLDIGSYWGYFCHRFEDIGFTCYAVENDHVNLYFLEKLKRADNKTFEIIPKSIFNCKEIKYIDFDVVLALNIFHHFLKTKESYDKFIDLLQNLHTKEMFFEPHLPEEFNDNNVYKNYTEDEFVQLILKNTTLKKSQEIGKAQDGRKIFKFS